VCTFACHYRELWIIVRDGSRNSDPISGGTINISIHKL
jgi:hypothetical protein